MLPSVSMATLLVSQEKEVEGGIKEISPLVVSSSSNVIHQHWSIALLCNLTYRIRSKRGECLKNLVAHRRQIWQLNIQKWIQLSYFGHIYLFIVMSACIREEMATISVNPLWVFHLMFVSTFYLNRCHVCHAP